jgi:hypothetical protein
MKDKLNTFLESGAYELLAKHPTAKVERQVEKLLSKNTNAHLTVLKHKLTPYKIKLPHL